ncbi:NACHT domain-containing protein [Streptomyces mirabilis]|jgi:translation initiation factor 1 (eIF-1/SUI1)|uniref:NACHT domain-containing protein n=1 Tax=Streptomyces mirabilis TaxID=68239 RepID=A0A1I2TPL1_9ACTN|nr:NACHT domain-containing protein [Streptomyces mirabilis]SFG66838.1 NACHT domain-containing protein [Streptomyces mirabilis]
MHGLEVVVVRLASTVAQTVAKSVLAPRPGAGLAAEPVRPLPKPAGPERLARVLGERIASAYATVPEHERQAAVAAVQDTFAAVGPIDADRLFAADLEPDRLAGELRRPVADLAERARDLYEELLQLCCAHLVEQLTAHPTFAARAAVEHTRRTGALLRERPVEGSAGEAVLDFEQRYADFIAGSHSRLELFGVTLGGRRRAEWPLDTAYISLAVSDERTDEPHREGFGVPSGTSTPVKVEEALAGCDRLVLRGPAGSGKSTLVQWLALNAARQSFGPELTDLNRCVPFVLRLRSFHTPDGLPMPEDFLTASGIPLRAPQGWAEELLANGRALVLVDGVDEVPPRLRNRTEHWLKSLLTAFPRARYVVTTRPSAVPEDWLATQNFMVHSLLPMNHDDTRAFIRHWHDATRRECVADTEHDALDRYEANLHRAVTTRRDLSRLATNPLMCALLCALNRDRRMQLPRARKELYDAALEMLLVRRDTEREITSVEGVSLSRDEQTALLQRLAYWLIRNGQVEAARDEVVAMLDEWLAAMPQVRVQGDAGQVLSHLLIRSGLLREPAPGYVDFVHRTFQDYLGAKAAVEARDFGVLVRNAHDDQWDDVVRMAVGHARLEERGQLLRQLLRRADRTPRNRQRLVLLAAASLEHAPELDPVVRQEVQDRAAELVPPRSASEAEQLSEAGELVLELLPGPEGLDSPTASAVVKTAALIGGDSALGVIARFRSDTRPAVATELAAAWASFDATQYADQVLSALKPATYVQVSTAAQLAELPRLSQLTHIGLRGFQGFPTEVLEQAGLVYLCLDGDRSLRDLSPLSQLPSLLTFTTFRCPEVQDLEPLRGLRLQRLFLHDLAPGMSLAPLADMPALVHLTLGFPPDVTRAGDIPAAPGLTALLFTENSKNITLDGLERWPSLSWLQIVGEDQGVQLSRMRDPIGLTHLYIHMQSSLDLTTVQRHRKLTQLVLRDCMVSSGLAPLRELPHLTRLFLWGCRGPIDLAPLADLDNLVVHINDSTDAVGREHLPPERLNPSE